MRKKPLEPVELPQEVWDVQQVMSFLKIGRTKLYELLNDGLPSVLIGKRRRFDPRDVAIWWQQQKEPA